MNKGGITNIGCENNFIVKLLKSLKYCLMALPAILVLWSSALLWHLRHVVLEFLDYMIWAYLVDWTKSMRKLENEVAQWLHNIFLVLTVAARQGVTPLVIFLTNNWLLITQRVTRVARERHSRAGGEAAATAAAVDRNTRIEARVRFHFHTCEPERQLTQLTNDCHIHIIRVIITPVFWHF